MSADNAQTVVCFGQISGSCSATLSPTAADLAQHVIIRAISGRHRARSGHSGHTRPGVSSTEYGSKDGSTSFFQWACEPPRCLNHINRCARYADGPLQKDTANSLKAHVCAACKCQWPARRAALSEPRRGPVGVHRCIPRSISGRGHLGHLGRCWPMASPAVSRHPPMPRVDRRTQSCPQGSSHATMI